MGATKREYTEIVTLFRKKLWANGLRYKKSKENLPGDPEVVFSNYKIVIFCYDDFSHGHNFDEIKKSGIDVSAIDGIEKQVKEDMQNESTLKANGWTVIKLWESKLSEDLEKCADIVVILISSIQAKESETENLLTITCPVCESKLYKNGYICPNCGELVEHLTKEKDENK